MAFNLEKPNENYKEVLSKETEDIINILNPWKIDEWVAIYIIVHGTLCYYKGITHPLLPIWLQKLELVELKTVYVI